MISTPILRTPIFRSGWSARLSAAREILPTVLTGIWKPLPIRSRGQLRNFRRGPLLEHLSAYIQVREADRRRRYAYIAEPYDSPELPIEPTLWIFREYLRSRTIAHAVIPLGAHPGNWETHAFVIAEPDLLRTPLPNHAAKDAADRRAREDAMWAIVQEAVAPRSRMPRLKEEI